MFNSITKKLKGEQSQSKTGKGMEGFICPICMASFVSPEMVQQHFEDKHPEDSSAKSEPEILFSPTTQRKESIRDIQENLNDLRQSLDEEVWYNEELKKECTRLNSIITEKDNTILSRDAIVEDYSKQITRMEAARDSLNEELKKSNTLKNSLSDENKTIRTDFHVCEEKLIESENCRKNLKNECERYKQDYAKLFDEISKLKSQLECSVDGEILRPLNEELIRSNSELEVTKLQLVGLSAIFENMKTTQNTKVTELEDKCDALTNQVTQLEADKSSFIQSNKILSFDYEEKLQASICACEDLKKKMNSLNIKVNESEDNLTKLKIISESDQCQLKEISNRLQESEQQCHEVNLQNKEFIQRIKDQDIEILQIRNACSNKEEEIKNLEKYSKNVLEQLSSVNEELNIERKAKDHLQSQVQMTDAANFIMEQIKVEKKNLQESLNNMKEQIDEERDDFKTECNKYRMEIQFQQEEILKLTSLVSEKEDVIKVSEKVTYDSHVACERYQERVNKEILNRSNLEDAIKSLKRDVQVAEESLNTSIETNYSLKNENQMLLKNLEQEREATETNMKNLNQKIEIANLKASEVGPLQKEVELAKEKNFQLNKEFLEKSNEKDILLETKTTLENNEKVLNLRFEEVRNNVMELENVIKKKDEEIMSQLNAIKSKEILLEERQAMIYENIEKLKVKDDELILIKESLTSLQNDHDENIKQLLSYKHLIEQSEEKLAHNMKLQTALESELMIMKENLIKQEDSMTLLCDEKKILEDKCEEKQNIIENLQKVLDSTVTEKESIETQLAIARIEIEEIQSLYNESIKQQNVMENELKNVSEELRLIKIRLLEEHEAYKKLQLEYSTEIDKLTKEGIQLKNHVKAIEKTFSESSENYKQERFEYTERELTLKSHCESLESSITKLTKSLQITEEDLEGEKSLRQTERNNMMEKISQLADKLSKVEKVRNDLDQKLDTVETDYIENKLRLETVVDEKEKLLEKIIQMENSMKKQNEGFLKKCREFDQLQSAILDLGRENQSLQITKEKISSRLWVVDDEAMECHNCHKLFSLTHRKHHCRNCGQVFCNECSVKTVTLAVSRKPVRVCDVCYLEIHSHRKNSSTQSSNISLSLQN